MSLNIDMSIILPVIITRSIQKCGPNYIGPSQKAEIEPT